MKNKILDEWDCRIIRHFKRSTVKNPIDIDTLKGIYSDRCGMDMDYVRLQDITEHLLDLAFELNLLDNSYRFGEFIASLDPKHNWKYVCDVNQYKKDETDFQMILLSRLDSLFSLTNVDKLPGYREYLTSIGE